MLKRAFTSFGEYIFCNKMTILHYKNLGFMSEVKDKVLSQIIGIENEGFLHTLSAMLSGVDSEGVYKLSPQQKIDINESLEQVKEGEVVSHKELFARLRTK